jgi:RHS repeat-associated protein
LAPTEAGATHTVTVTTAEGRTMTYAMTELGTGGLRQAITGTDGLQTVGQTATDGTETITSPDGTVVTTRYGPDPRFGMLSPLIVSSTVQTPGGLTYQYQEGRTTTVSNPDDPFSLTQLVGTTTVNGQTWTDTYDAAAHTLTEVTPEGRTTVTTLDALGHVVREEVPGLTAVQYTYDSHGLLSRITQGPRVTTLAYGPDGLVASVTDPLNQTVRYGRDALGRVRAVTLADGRQFQVAYDAAGHVTGVTPPGRPAHALTYDLAGDLQQYQPPAAGPGGSATQDTYNNDRQLTHVSRPDGTAIDLHYDNAGRLQSLATAAGTTTRAYNATGGQLQTMAAPDNGTLTFGYDGSELNSLTWAGAVAGSVTGTYDNDFRLTSVKVNGTGAVNFQYDREGLLTQAGDLVLARDTENGRVIGTTLGGVTDAVGYDAFGDVISYQASFNDTALFAQDDTRDDLGRLTHRVETIAGVTHTYDYGYDAAGRLQQVKTDGVVTASYGSDANDNRLSVARPGGTVSGTYDAQDRLTQYGTTTYTYTAAGELQGKTDAATNQTTTFDYDALGNLQGATLPDGTAIAYVIDGNNERIGKEVNGVLVQGFLYDGDGRVVAELDGGDQVVSRFVYASAANVPDYLIKGGVTYRLITDQAGSVRRVVRADTGEVAQRLDYDEFGRVLQDTAPGFQPFGFAGGLYDRDTGLVRFGARDYDAQTGRWTAKDPIGFAGGQTNLYVYAGNDPVNFTDPTGLWRGFNTPATKQDPQGRPTFWGPLSDAEKKERALDRARHGEPPVKQGECQEEFDRWLREDKNFKSHYDEIKNKTFTNSHVPPGNDSTGNQPTHTVSDHRGETNQLGDRPGQTTPMRESVPTVGGGPGQPGYRSF